MTLLKSLPPFEGKRIKISSRQSVSKIVGEILGAHSDYASHYDKIASYFLTGNRLSIERDLWDFCKENLEYNIESGQVQTVRSPAAILMLNDTTGVDCKHYANFIGGILDAINRTGRARFNWFYRFASYSATDNVPGHVFVVVKNHGVETWIDPVLNSFDARVPFPVYIEDIKPKTMALFRVSGIDRKKSSVGCPAGYSSTNYGLMENQGCSCRSMGAATGQQVGNAISSVAPVLAVVPVVGWVAAAGAEVIGLFLHFFGSKYTESTGVRWLTQLFEYYVLGLPTKSDNQVNEGNIANSQKWFAYVLGVPMYDRPRFDALRNSAQAYLAFPDTKDIDPAIAEQAHQRALGLNYGLPSGGWKTATVAPWLVSSSNTTATTSVNSAGQVVTTTGQPGVMGWVRSNPLKSILIAGLGGLALYKLS